MKKPVPRDGPAVIDATAGSTRLTTSSSEAVAGSGSGVRMGGALTASAGDSISAGAALDSGNDTCVASDGTLGTAGIGWAWGSIIVRTPDDAIREVVYLYIGYCVDTHDMEAFYYADDPIELCAPPG